jgi:hypothetical protein
MLPQRMLLHRQPSPSLNSGIAGAPPTLICGGQSRPICGISVTP